MHPQTYHTKQHVKASHTSTIAHKPYKYETKLEIGRFMENTKDLSFPYLENASKSDIAVVRRSNYHYFSNFSIASL